jgi:hypothetical protein
MKVQAPDGRVWRVRRTIRWPRWRDFGDPTGWMDGANALDFVSGPGDLIASLAIAVFLAVVVAALIVLFLPLIVFVFEALAVVAAAIAFRRPWLVVASTSDSPSEERRWLVRGFLGSRGAVREVADELRRGVPAEPEAFEQ